MELQIASTMASKEDLNKAVRQLHEYVIDETCKLDNLSEQQVGRLITEFVTSYTLHKEYMYNIAVRVLEYLRDISIWVTILSVLYAIFAFSQQNRDIGIIILPICIIAASGVPITFMILKKIGTVMKDLDIKAKTEIVAHLACIFEDYSEMSEKEKEESYYSFLKYAGLEVEKKQKS